MKGMQKIKLALALAALLAMGGTGWAKPNGPGLPGDLNGSRDSVVLSVPVPAYDACDTTNANQTYSVKAYIFQPSGRMFAIGTSDPTSFTCSLTTEQLINMTVNAFLGLTFKPGPATLLYKVILTEDDGNIATPLVDSVIYEYGSRVDLH
ncbi:MAG TPA: hypothetical protein VFM05_06370 [Candidatus Saccharimonadales bacterium]|nr:hypothetical protein [Candidatus Saccharimonadales bacterium]